MCHKSNADGDNISAPGGAPAPAAGAVTVWWQPADNVFGPKYPISISQDTEVRISLSNGFEAVSHIPHGDYNAINDIQQALTDVQEACADGSNLLKPIVAAAKAYATLGEIVVSLKAEFGEWQEAAVF